MESKGVPDIYVGSKKTGRKESERMLYYKVIDKRTRQVLYGFPEYLSEKIGCEKKEIREAAEKRTFLMGCYKVFFINAKGIIPEKEVWKVARATGLEQRFIRKFDIDWTNTVLTKKASGINLNIPIVSQESSHSISGKGGLKSGT